MIEFAKEFATEAHEGQVRKYTGEPYITHPLEVADLVAAWLCAMDASDADTEEAIVCAILHDVVEDTATTIYDIENLFGSKVARGVWLLTDPPNFVGNRKTRKLLTQARLAQAPEHIKIVKFCDILHNKESIKEFDPKFYKVFVKETDALIEVMFPKKVDNPILN